MSAISKLKAAAETRLGGSDDTGIFAADLAGYSAQAGSKVLLQNWETALADGCDHNLVADIDLVINAMRQFKMAAWEHLPLKNGGLGGQTAQHWIDALSEIDVSVYEAEDMPGVFGFTECEADDYGTETDALVAAVLANAEALGLDDVMAPTPA